MVAGPIVSPLVFGMPEMAMNNLPFVGEPVPEMVNGVLGRIVRLLVMDAVGAEGLAVTGVLLVAESDVLFVMGGTEDTTLLSVLLFI